MKHTDNIMPKAKSQDEHVILLVGDSIIDNHYWHYPQVGQRCTGDTLTKLAASAPGNIKVMNHSVEETRAAEWYQDTAVTCSHKILGTIVRTVKTVNMDAAKMPARHYIENARRHQLVSTYPTLPVPFFPNVNPSTSKDYSNLTIVVSAIGNDLFLNGEWSTLVFKPSEFVNRLDGIFQAYKQKYPGCRVIYVFPYRPDNLLGWKLSGVSGMYFDYKVSTIRSQILSCESLDDIIDLSKEFKYQIHYDDPGTGIPEPTPEGAQYLAKLILDTAQRQWR